MQKVLDFFKTQYGKILIATISTVLGAIGWDYIKIKTDPNATKPEIIIVIPGGDEPLPVIGAAADTPRVGMIRIRVRAASQMADEQGWKGAAGFIKAWRAVSKVKDDDIAAAAIKAGFQPPAIGELGDGTFLKKLIEWFSDPANQEKIIAFIKLIITLAMAFATNDLPGNWPAALASWNA